MARVGRFKASKRIVAHLNEEILLDLGRFQQLADGPLVGVVVLKQDGHLKRGGLEGVPEKQQRQVRQRNSETNENMR